MQNTETLDPTDNCSLPQSEVLLLSAPPPPPKEPIGLAETLAVLSGGSL